MRLFAHGIYYSYAPGGFALRRASLGLGEGEVLFLLGPNGSGKTTLLECLGGLRRPAGGRVLLGDLDLYSLPSAERARAIAYVPQLHRPVFGYRVEEVVLLGRAPHLKTFSTPRRRDREIARRALAGVGLEHLAGRPYTELSGGELRLVLVARGLAQGAHFLLLDEPDAHLDPKNRHRVLGLLGDLAAGGRGVLVTTHDPNAALRYAQRVALLSGGEVLAEGPTDRVLVPEQLSRAYGLSFSLLRGEDGQRALVPS